MTQDTTLDWSTRQRFEGQWDKVRGKAKEEWAELTDDELQEAEGNWEQFVGTVKKKTGETIDAIEAKVNSWLD